MPSNDPTSEERKKRIEDAEFIRKHPLKEVNPRPENVGTLQESHDFLLSELSRREQEHQEEVRQARSDECGEGLAIMEGMEKAHAEEIRKATEREDELRGFVQVMTMLPEKIDRTFPDEGAVTKEAVLAFVQTIAVQAHEALSTATPPTTHQHP